MSDLTKDEILRKYIVSSDSLFDGALELHFIEGGRKTVVVVYPDSNDAVQYSEEDALAHWMNVLKRGVADNG
jgi:hypothetical protein